MANQELVQDACENWRNDVAVFVATGELSTDCAEHIDSCTDCLSAINKVMDGQMAGMEALGQTIAHERLAHRKKQKAHDVVDTSRERSLKKILGYSFLVILIVAVIALSYNLLFQ